MKRNLFKITAVLLAAFALMGCSSQEAQDSASQADVKKEAVSYASKYSTAEVADMIAGYPNLEAAEDLQIDIKDVDALYRYTDVLFDIRENNAEYDKQFREMFSYIFPDHEINENYLYYSGGHSKIEYDEKGNCVQDLNLVKDWQEKILDEEETGIYYIYDESWHGSVTAEELEDAACLELANPMGYGYGVFNRGKTELLSGKKVYSDTLGTDQYPGMESYDPMAYLDIAAEYTPDSTDSYPLSDGEIPIKDAVAFFEEYVNGLPYPADANAETSVTKVYVLKVTDDIYGYYFVTTMRFHGVVFDHLMDYSKTSEYGNYTFTGGFAMMVCTDEVDVLGDYYRLTNMQDETELTEILPFGFCQ